MKKPNLFIVGAPKSGTTAFHNFLNQHPEIFMSREKEPYFFCKDLHEDSDFYHKGKKYFRFREEKDYLRLFSSAKNEKVLGESSTFYLYSRVAAQEIYKFNSDSKIIIMLRNPVDFIYSLHSHWFVETYEDVEDFNTAIELEEQRSDGKSLPTRIYFPLLVYYSQLIKYHDYIKRYFDVFERSNIKIIIFDEFKNNNLKIYKDTLTFLDVDNEFIPDFKNVNVSKRPRNKKLNYFAQNIFIIEILRLIFPPKIHSIIKKFGQNVLWKEEKRKAMDSNLKDELMKKFRPEVVKTSELIGVNLENYWYK